MSINFFALNKYDFVAFQAATMHALTIGGKCAVQGNFLLSQSNVGTQLPIVDDEFYFVINNSGSIDGGTNTGDTAISSTSAVGSYTMENLNGTLPIVASPLNFSRAYDYIVDAGPIWSFERTNMTVTVENDVLTLEGTNITYNSASFIAQNLAGKEVNISSIKTINIVAPLNSTILISTLDIGSISFPEAVTIQRNGIPITPDNAASYAPYIVWNFSRNNYLQLNNVTIYGTLINIAEARGIAGSCTMSNFKVYGQLFVNSAVLSFGTIFHMPFQGALPDSTDLPDVGEFDASKDGVLIFKDNVQYIKYTVTVSNTGTLPLTDVVLNDTPSSNLKIEEGTIKVDSVSVSGNLLDGLSLGTMQPNVTIFITFYATITI